MVVSHGFQHADIVFSSEELPIEFTWLWLQISQRDPWGKLGAGWLQSVHADPRNSRWKFMAAIDLNMFLNFTGWVSCWEFHTISIIVSSVASLCSLCFRLSSLCFCCFSPFLKFNCRIFWGWPPTIDDEEPFFWAADLDSSWIVPGFYFDLHGIERNCFILLMANWIPSGLIPM